MSNPQIFLGLAVVIFIGLLTAVYLRLGRKTVLTPFAVDEMRRMLWEKGLTARDIRKLGFLESFKQFGFAALPNAMYKNFNFAEITTEDDRKFYAKIILAFEKEVLEKELKEAQS